MYVVKGWQPNRRYNSCRVNTDYAYWSSTAILRKSVVVNGWQIVNTILLLMIQSNIALLVSSGPLSMTMDLGMGRVYASCSR